MSKHKFEIGDRVIIISGGMGAPKSTEGRIVTITDKGYYKRHEGDTSLGYKITPRIGNSLTGSYGGFIGENSFEKIEIHNRIDLTV